MASTSNINDDVDEYPIVIIDFGSETTKAGFGGDKTPKYVIPTIVGTKVQGTTSSTSTFIGKDALSIPKSNTFNPMQAGMVVDWNGIEKVMHSIIYKHCSITPEESVFLLTETALTPRGNREKMTQMCFETFNCGGINFSLSSMCTLYSTLSTTGVVCDIGHGKTEIVPIYEGYALPHAILRQKTCGKSLTAYLSRLLRGRYALSDKPELLSKLKIHSCYVAKNYNHELTQCGFFPGQFEHIFDVGKDYGFSRYSVTSSRFKIPEALFNPASHGIDEPGITNATNSAIQKCEVDIRSELFSNIVLTGGSSQFVGFENRFFKEMQLLSPNQIRVDTTLVNPNSSWMGASMLSQSSGFESLLISKEEYDESGPTIHRRRCF